MYYTLNISWIRLDDFESRNMQTILVAYVDVFSKASILTYFVSFWTHEIGR